MKHGPDKFWLADFQVGDCVVLSTQGQCWAEGDGLNRLAIRGSVLKSTKGSRKIKIEGNVRTHKPH